MAVPQRRTQPSIVKTGYTPRVQQSELHSKLKRFNVLVCHRRFGKTVALVNQLLHSAAAFHQERALMHLPPLQHPRFWYVAPFLRQAKQIAWTYLQQYGMTITGAQKNESELYVELPGGARVTITGADNPDSLRGIYGDGVVFDEYAQMDPRIWSEVVRPWLADRKGWAVFIGTPMGRNEFWNLYEQAKFGFWTHPEGDPMRRRVIDNDWLALMYRASETRILPEEELASLKRSMSLDQFEREFECSFDAAVEGAYYGKEMAAAEKEGRITALNYDPRYLVRTAWDLGIGDSTAIWFIQTVGTQFRFIDYYEASGVGLDHYVKVLRDKPYAYADYILPHDAAAKEIGTGFSREETLRSLGCFNLRILPRQRIEDGIQAARSVLPRCVFDRDKCDRGIRALKDYHREWDDRLKIFKSNPLHNWASHAADGFRYGALGLAHELDPVMKPINYGKVSRLYI